MEYRKRRKKLEDSRTHKTQFRRDMFDDSKYSSLQVERALSFFDKRKPTEDDVLELIGMGPDRFHSIDQLKNFLQHRKRTRRQMAA